MTVFDTSCYNQMYIHSVLAWLIPTVSVGFYVKHHVWLICPPPQGLLQLFPG